MKRIAAIVVAFSLAACATIMHGTTQGVGISSSPTGAQVTVDNKPLGNTPIVADLSRKDNHIVHVSMAGYAPADLTLTRGVSGWVWGNIVFGGLIGLVVDAVSGGLYNLTPAQLQATLSAQHAQVAPAKSGIYVVMVRQVDPAWVKIGQLTRLEMNVVGQ